jgi:hypothetical protein
MHPRVNKRLAYNAPEKTPSTGLHPYAPGSKHKRLTYNGPVKTHSRVLHPYVPESKQEAYIQCTREAAYIRMHPRVNINGLHTVNPRRHLRATYICEISTRVKWLTHGGVWWVNTKTYKHTHTYKHPYTIQICIYMYMNIYNIYIYIHNTNICNIPRDYIIYNNTYKPKPKHIYI